MEQFARTTLLVGEDAMARLNRSRVAVFGVGGVGGYAAEALIRSGVGAMDLFDNDQVSVTNLNRQIIALHSTIGRDKTDVMAERLLDVNPEAKIIARKLFYLPETADQVDLSAYDYIVDAVDTLAAKLELAERAQTLGVPIISAMGAGNKLDPAFLRIADIYETSVDPLARAMRSACRKRGIRRLTVAYSTETPLRPAGRAPDGPAPAAGRRDTPGSTAFMPSSMGLMIAGYVVRALMAR